MSDNHVGAIIKDKKGYLWLTTQNGLDRFDGVEFKTFLHNPADSNSVLSNYVTSLAEDSLGRIWVATYNGLSMYNPVNGKFWNYIPPEKEFVKNRILNVLAARNGSVWFSTWNRLNAINLETLQITSYLIDSLPVNPGEVSIDYFFEDHEGNFWFDSYHGLSVFNRMSHRVSLLDKNYGLLSFYDDGVGHAWMGCWQNAFREYDFKEKKFTDYFFDNRNASTSIIRNITLTTPVNYPGLESLLWLGTEQELAVFDTRTKRFINYYGHNPSIPNSLPVTGTTHVFFDGKNQLWISTGAGLYTLNVNQLCISSFYFPEYADRPVNMIREDKKDTTLLWLVLNFGGMYGVNRYTGNIVQHFLPGSQKPDDDLNGFADFVQDDSGTIWLAGVNGIIKYNPSTKQYRIIKAPASNLPGGQNEFYTLLLNPDGTVWFGASAGLGKFDTRTESFRYYFHYTPDSNQHLGTHLVRTMMKDSEGNIWLFNRNDGLIVFNPSTSTFTNKYIAGIDLKHVPQHAIIQTPDSTIWLTTGDQLFYKKNSDTAFHALYNSEMDAWMYHLACDKYGNLFIGMQTGLLKYEKKSGRFTKFTTMDGLAENQINMPGNVEADGILYIMGTGFMSAVDTKRLNKQYTKANLVFESLTINAKDTALDFDLYKNKALRLNYKQNQLTAHFRLLSLSDAQQVRYAYKLDGWDKNWVSSNTGNYAGYSNLPGGDYTLHVKAINPDGTENAQQATMLIHISPPFWKTSWFKFLDLLAAASILYLVYRIRANRRLAIERTRTRIARDLHDDIGSTLTSISYFSTAAKLQLQDKEQNGGELMLDKIGESSRSMINSMNDIVWAINPKNDRLEDLIARMKYYAAEILGQRDIMFYFSIKGNIKGVRLKMEARKNYFLIFKESIHNIVKYANCKTVNILIAYNHQQLTLTVKDDGTGFEKGEVTGEGNGMQNMQQRGDEISGQLVVESTKGGGTTITLSSKIT